jgi:striatin 1/3/4
MAWQSQGMGGGNNGNGGPEAGNQNNQPQGTEYTLQGE